jgi:hypothetical protein
MPNRRHIKQAWGEKHMELSAMFDWFWTAPLACTLSGATKVAGFLSFLE